MDLRLADEATQNRESVDRATRRINTCIPGEIQSFDPETQTATVVPAVKLRTAVDGEEGFLEMPAIVQAPLVFPFVSVAGYALTLPVRPKDPCLILFAQRAIDNWHDNGGIQQPEEGVGGRHHDLTDALVLMAPSPLPEVLGDWQTDGIEIRNRDRDAFIKIADDGTITITSAVKVTIDCPDTEITGDVQINGGLTHTGTYGSSGGAITTPGTIQSTGSDVIDQVRSMAADRTIYNGHTHPETGSVTQPPNQQE